MLCGDPASGTTSVTSCPGGRRRRWWPASRQGGGPDGGVRPSAWSARSTVRRSPRSWPDAIRQTGVGSASPGAIDRCPGSTSRSAPPSRSVCSTCSPRPNSVPPPVPPTSRRWATPWPTWNVTASGCAGCGQVLDRTRPHPAHPEAVTFHVGQGVAHRRLVGGTGGGTEFGRGEQVEHTDRLGGAEREVEPGHRSIAPGLAEPTPVCRIASGQDLGERRTVDRADQAEGLTPPSGPPPWRLAGHQRLLRPPGHEVTDVVPDAGSPHNMHPQHLAPAMAPPPWEPSYRSRAVHVISCYFNHDTAPGCAVPPPEPTTGPPPARPRRCRAPIGAVGAPAKHHRPRRRPTPDALPIPRRQRKGCARTAMPSRNPRRSAPDDCPVRGRTPRAGRSRTGQ